MSRKRFELIATALDRKGKVICSASNSYVKSDPLQAYFAKQVGLQFPDHPAGYAKKVNIHAEILCLKRAGAKKVHTLMVERYSVDGDMLLAMPCPICKLAIQAFGVKKVVFTTEDGFNEWIV